MKLAKLSECTACMACLDSCNRGALSLKINDYGFYEIETNQLLCVECGACSRACPIVSNKTQVLNKSVANLAYACWTEDEYLRSISASGGAFVALASEIIKQGGVVYGASLDGFRVRHIRVTDNKDLVKIAGSKYQQSEMIGVYRMVKKDLKEGRIVLFGGLSCQIAALKNFVGTLSDNLFTIDTICGGLSTMAPMSALQATGEYKGIFSFRDKSKGWKSQGFKYSLKLSTQNDEVENLGMNNFPMKSFCSPILKRSSCLDCKFNGFDRIADCTIGDYWGDDRFPQEHHDGLSVLIKHNDRLDEIIDASSLHIEPTPLADIIRYNNNYFWSHYPFIRNSRLRKRILRAMEKQDMSLAESIMDHPTFFDRLFLKVHYWINTKQKQQFYKLHIHK